MNDITANIFDHTPALSLVKKYEGLRLKVYKCPAGLDTIGYGHVILDNEAELRKGITKEQAEELLLKDLGRFFKGVLAMVKVPITDNMLCALVSFSFNIGLNALKNSTLLKKVNSRKYVEAADEFKKWTKARVNGKLTSLPGLIKRRTDERDLFLRGYNA